MHSEGKNKETMNKHVYLLSSANARSLSGPGREPLLVRNYCARRTIRTKAWSAYKIQIYSLCLPTRIISNDYIIYGAQRGLEQKRIVHICHRENLNRILINCFFLLILGSSITYMFYWSEILVDFSIVLKSPLPTHVM
ncbi:hypothetical protein T12_3774 [Trichinella patagoniensis]|uniref:Uncharacterized protein n=1 Tax=Trichinella patagoniensis TaxID=990121 RepID=A0A0V0Z2E8_9BILA|nr:hypothetical protein T12_3774 [Trichinella patagoniensis]